MLDPSYLLTDDQMRQFISHGYLVLKADFSKEFHETMRRKIEEVMAKEGNPGNNILPRVPEIQDVFDHPTVSGALTSVLGPDYIMHPHRHGHYSEPGRKTQTWHKDSYWGHAKVRNHHPWWAMIFYFNQDVVEEMGPSAIMPGTQYYHARPGDESEVEAHVLGEAGTMALIHYDIWHKGTANISDRNRSMLKFQFVRMDRPQAPTWNNTRSDWTPMNGEGPTNQHEVLWQHQWRWLSGQTTGNGAASGPDHPSVGALITALMHTDRRVRLRAADELGLLGQAAGDAIPALVAALDDDYEPVAINAAYALANMGPDAIAPLTDTLRASFQAGASSKDAARNAAYALTALGPDAVPAMAGLLSHESESARGYAAYVLGEIGPATLPVVPALVKLANDESEWVRRNLVEALGTLGEATDGLVTTLTQALTKDADAQVRFTAALSLARLGAQAVGAVPALQQALKDENRYVRANAVDALNRIGTPEAKDILIHYLMAARWCPSTTPENLF
ncbi:MAG: HEAT repeat domain-containing protein [Chloroflexi bacterium]|nr:HEAT repeat domain-containing protein [Chloroflexota bacterium]